MGNRAASLSLGEVAPLLLACGYFLLVASFPTVSAPQLLRLTGQYAGLSLSFLMLTAMFCIVACLVAKAVRRDLGERPAALIARLVRKRWHADKGLSFIVPTLFFAILLAAFNAFKQSILPLAGFGLDGLFAQWDRAIFGVHPWQISHAFFSAPTATLVLSQAYHQYFLPMALGVFLCAVLPGRPRLRTQYLLSFALVWILVGSVLAFLMPSAGAVFWGEFHPGPDPFRPLADTLARHHDVLVRAGHAEGLGAHTFQIALAGDFGGDRLAIGRGISAMPSVHIALAVQFACAAFALDRRLGWVATAYGAAMWVASIHLGWHYAVDGIVAAVVTIPLWLGCGQLARRLHAVPLRPIREPRLPSPAMLGGPACAARSSSIPTHAARP
jgi:PAP2 superfamily protein